MQTPVTVTRLDLKKTESLTVEFGDGKVHIFPLSVLRSNCPCASCRTLRESQAARPRGLTILPGNYSGPITATSAELVGNYALQIEWSDGHGSGIYSWEFLRELAAEKL